jgi:hypothetical protein
MPTKMVNIKIFLLMHKKRKEMLQQRSCRTFRAMKKCKKIMTMLKKVKMKNMRLIALPLTKKEWMWILRSLQSQKMMWM